MHRSSLSRRAALALMPLMAAMLLASCDSGAPASSPASAGDKRDGPLEVVCTVAMVTDLARTIAGDRASVTGLIGEGVDPHLYKPTRSDIQALLDADLVIYNGLLLEGKMTDALIRSGQSGATVVPVADGIDPTEWLEPEGADGHYDPHLWMDPVAWSQGAQVIRDALIKADPAGEGEYRANAAELLSEMEALQEYAQRVLQSVPESSRVLVTAHDAFNYFGRRYGFEVVGIQGISTESEAGVRDVEQLVELLVTRKVGAVFTESTVSERNVRALIDGARARGHTVIIGGSLFSDAMGAPGTYEGTYIGMIDHNVTMIARALGGQAPAGGMNGRLRSTEAAPSNAGSAGSAP